jgi:NAD(P)-dependent dehydrogenase (short-subunit alcohol dehydrogenase family)
MNGVSRPVAIVTGAGRGIGRAIALRLVEDGYLVAGCSRSAGQLDDVRDACEPGVFLAVPADLNDLDVPRALVERAVSHYGRLDALVNAAGISPVWQRAEETAIEDWDSIMRVNVRAAFLLCREAGAAMLGAGSGSIVNVASIGGQVALPRLVAYCAAKAALLSLTRVLAVEWGARGVRVNAVAPGYVETEMTQGLTQNPVLHSRLVEATPLARLAAPQEVAAAVSFLVSEGAAFVNGATLAVDGGWTAQ